MLKQPKIASYKKIKNKRQGITNNRPSPQLSKITENKKLVNEQVLINSFPLISLIDNFKAISRYKKL